MPGHGHHDLFLIEITAFFNTYSCSLSQEHSKKVVDFRSYDATAIGINQDVPRGEH